jgi:hypothetical protein
LIFLFLHLVVYYSLATIFGGRAAMDFKGRISVIGLGTILVTTGLSHVLPGWTGIVSCLVLGAVVSFLGLTRWLELTTKQALKIAISYIAYMVAFSYFIGYLQRD